MQELRTKIIQLGIKRGYLNRDNPKAIQAQFLKLKEEVGELARAILRQDRKQIIDGIGDSAVVLIGLEYLGYDKVDLPQHVMNLISAFKVIDGSQTHDARWFALEFISKNQNVDLLDAVSGVYDIIEKRKGNLINNNFVKSSDSI